VACTCWSTRVKGAGAAVVANRDHSLMPRRGGLQPWVLLLALAAACGSDPVPATIIANVSLYDGSFIEWTRTGDTPVA